MKLKSTLLAAILAMFAGATATAIAAEAEMHDTAPTKQGGVNAGYSEREAAMHDTAPTKQGEASQPVKKPVKKHSHMEEKTNMPMNEPAPHMDKEMPKDRHDHLKEKH